MNDKQESSRQEGKSTTHDEDTIIQMQVFLEYNEIYNLVFLVMKQEKKKTSKSLKLLTSFPISWEEEQHEYWEAHHLQQSSRCPTVC